jgi:rare lipoprotein A
VILTVVALLWLGSGSPAVASWYGNEAGPLCADGSPFDPAGMTCASPSLPFGAVLLVEYGRRAVLVHVTDRGPFAVDSTGRAVWPLQPHPRRCLDLSAGAAKALHFCGAGVGRVTVWRIR